MTSERVGGFEGKTYKHEIDDTAQMGYSYLEPPNYSARQLFQVKAHGRILDYSSEGKLIGIEWFNPRGGIDLTELPESVDKERILEELRTEGISDFQL